MTATLRFSGLLDLARLPYFRVVGGRLCIADKALGGAIDVHTHLALAYGPFENVDLLARGPRAEHYLKPDRPIDFEGYQNLNFSPDDLRELEKDLSLRSLGKGGMRATHTIPNLEHEMNELGIVQSVLLPIDLPVLSDNARRYLRASRGHRELVCFGSVHPLSRDLERRLDEQKAMGARGVKMHPAVQLMSPSHPRSIRLFRLCGERDMAVFFHCGPVGIEHRLGRELSQLYRYEKPIAECPGTVFVLGHAGALQLDQALALSLRYPNVYLEVASQSLSNIERLVHEAPPDRLLFGTDWPFYHQAIGLAKVLLATEHDESARRRVLHDNADRLLRAGAP